jgi:predicted glutamine amidotransferase
MCEIHFIKKFDKQKITEYDIQQMTHVMEDAGKHHKHGWGITDGKIIYKRPGAYKCKKYDSRIEKNFAGSDLLIGHNRFKTHGKEKKMNSHPFYNKRYVWVHNGIIYNADIIAKDYGYQNNVDSEVIGHALLSETGNEKTDIVNDLAKLVERFIGYYSIFIYDKLTDKLYYLKNEAEFTFQLLRNHDEENPTDILIGSTDEYNLFDMYQGRDGISQRGIKTDTWTVLSRFTPVDGNIYEITDYKLIHKLAFNPNLSYMYAYNNKVVKYYGNKGGDTIDDYNTDDYADEEWCSWDEGQAEMILSEIFNDDVVIYPMTDDIDKLTIDANDFTLDTITKYTNIDARKQMTLREICDIVDILYYEYGYYNEIDVM